MDICHLILGRPWQFDFGVCYDGRANVYSLEWKGRKLRLLPILHTPRITSGGSAAYSIITGPQLLSLIKTQQDAFVLCVMESTAGGTSQACDHRLHHLLDSFLELFPTELPNRLPPQRTIQHQIDLVHGATIPNLLHFRLNPTEQQILNDIVEDLLNKQFICHSFCPCVVPALIVHKKGGCWRICIDSRAVNKITIKYRFSMLRFEDMLDCLSGATTFFKLDLYNGYHHICIGGGDEWKTTFKMPAGLFEWRVMPFGLCNDPSTFMRLMHEILKEFINKCCVVYFDYILVDSPSFEEHLVHLSSISSLL